MRVGRTTHGTLRRLAPRLRRWSGGAALGFLATLLLAGPTRASTLAGPGPDLAAQVNLAWVLGMSIVALLLTWGHVLLGVAAAPRPARSRAAGILLAAAFVAALGYLAVGFAFQYGGIGAIPVLGGGQSLSAEWFPLHRFWGAGWGLIGYTGFLLQGLTEPTVLAFFCFQLTLLLATVSIPVAALVSWIGPKGSRARSGAALILALACAAFLVPLFGNWAWGRGWLSQAGHTLQAGHGYVDFAGGGVVFLAGALAGLAALVTLGTRPPAEDPPPADEGLLAAGGLLALTGGLAVVLGNFLGLTDNQMASTLVSVLGAALGGGAAGFVYMGFAARRLDMTLGLRGLLAGLAAMTAGGPFIPPADAVLTGLIAGALACLGAYLLDRLRLPDRTGLVTAYGLGGLWGLLAVGLFADGSYGVGWNGVGATTYLGAAGRGVTGYLAGDPSQLHAQVAGIAAAMAVVFVGALLVCRLLNRLGWLRGEEE